jgi:hypothetical protein
MNIFGSSLLHWYVTGLGVLGTDGWDPLRQTDIGIGGMGIRSLNCKTVRTGKLKLNTVLNYL